MSGSSRLSELLSDDGVEGYASGAKSINPDAVVTVTYVSGAPDAAAFNDPAGGQAIAQQLLAQDPDIDVMFQVAGLTGNGVLQAACDAGINAIGEKFPDLYVKAGIMERGNFAAAAGFGMEAGKQGIFGTFSAFLEMCVSEITMARLNGCNVLCHFSHAGVDDMADNTCHFGLNNFFADNGLDDDELPTRLYFPADGGQMRACVRRIFNDPGLRFVFSNRSKLPVVLDESGNPLFGDGYEFVPGNDEVVRDASPDGGFVVTFGDTLYRALDAVERLRADGMDIGLINKPTLNVVDEEMMEKLGTGKWVLVAESLNRRSGLGIRFGTWLLQRGYAPRYDHVGTNREGSGGLWEQMGHQGLDSEQLQAKIREFADVR